MEKAGYPNDLYGVSDVWGTQFTSPAPVLRPATAGEETPELQQPIFSNATRPIVALTMFVRVYGEFLTVGGRAAGRQGCRVAVPGLTLGTPGMGGLFVWWPVHIVQPVALAMPRTCRV